MSKEKVIFKNGTHLEYDSISVQPNALVIGFVGGDAEVLESTFRTAGQENLEEIKQTDAQGALQATHKLYDVLSQITVHIDFVEGSEGDKQNLVEVTLTKEEAWQAEIRKLRDQVKELSGGRNSEAVEELDVRVTNVENDVQSISNAIMGKEEK